MTPEAIKRVCKAAAALCVVVGGWGSILCLPYACGNNITWIAAAGIYLTAGAVMIVGGLISFALFCQGE